MLINLGPSKKLAEPNVEPEKKLLPDGSEYRYQSTCYCPLCVEERKSQPESK